MTKLTTQHTEKNRYGGCKVSEQGEDLVYRQESASDIHGNDDGSDDLQAGQLQSHALDALLSTKAVPGCIDHVFMKDF
jgi:hypothetical protein